MKSILILILTINILSESDYEKCIRLSKKYPQFSLQCENINSNNSNNNNILSVINNFRQTYLKDYNKYLTNSDYNDLIKEVYDKISPTNFKFKQDNFFDKLSNNDERKTITKSFLDNLSDKELYNQIHEQKDYIDKNNLKKMTEEFEAYEGEQDKSSLELSKPNEEGKKFYNSISQFVKQHNGEYTINGIIAPDGHIQVDDIGNYIRAESKVVHEAFKDNKLELKDLDKLMHLENLLK
jgi:hypothetical protein